MTGESILSVKSLTKKYGRLTVLDEVSFSVGPGSIVALLGANGAGKTTTFKCILGMTDFRGQIEVAGKSVAKAGKEVRALVGYLPQTPGFSDDDTCFQALRFLADLRGVSVSRIGPLLEKVNLVAQRDVRIRELSGGMRQRLALAAALLSDPPLLLLDEPTANLDAQSREELHALLAQLRQEGRTVILSTHFVEHVADLCDRVILLGAGKVELDESAAGLMQSQGRYMTVYLNGTPSESFMAALRNAGIGQERVTPERRGLQEAISRRLAQKAGDRESAK
jgi:ABC-type multidrug transport system ATPase subunit